MGIVDGGGPGIQVPRTNRPDEDSPKRSFLLVLGGLTVCCYILGYGGQQDAPLVQPPPPCTFSSATAYLRESDDFYGAWWAEASEMYGYDPTYRFTVADFPHEDDRWMIEAADLDLAACMAVERVKQLEERR